MKAQRLASQEGWAFKRQIGRNGSRVCDTSETICGTFSGKEYHPQQVCHSHVAGIHQDHSDLPQSIPDTVQDRLAFCIGSARKYLAFRHHSMSHPRHSCLTCCSPTIPLPSNTKGRLALFSCLHLPQCFSGSNLAPAGWAGSMRRVLDVERHSKHSHAGAWERDNSIIHNKHPRVFINHSRHRSCSYGS